MPVKATMAGGMPTPGFTSEVHSVTDGTPPPGQASTRTMPISVTRSRAARVPVVSRSTKASEGAKSRMATGDQQFDKRTFVRYSTAMANDRSYLAALQDYYARHRA